MEPIQAYRTLTIPVDTGDKIRDIPVPFTMELLERFEETIQKCSDYGWGWLRVKKADKSIITAYAEFCKPYIGDLDLQKMQPNFAQLFFSRVRNELVDSMRKSQGLTDSTAE